MAAVMSLAHSSSATCCGPAAGVELLVISISILLGAWALIVTIIFCILVFERGLTAGACACQYQIMRFVINLASVIARASPGARWRDPGGDTSRIPCRTLIAARDGCKGPGFIGGAAIRNYQRHGLAASAA